MLDNLPMTRKAAIEAGSKTYFTGKPCLNGHVAVRYVGPGCSQCNLDRVNSWNAANREKVNQKARSRSHANPEKEAARQRRYVSENRETRQRVAKSAAVSMRLRKPFYNVLSTVKCRARELGVPFDLDNEFLMSLYETRPVCPITRKRMLLSFEPGPLRDRASIDRKAPSGGYTRDNVTLISYAANAMKSDHTDPALFDRMATYIRSIEST